MAFKTDLRLMYAKSITECSKVSILSKLPVVINTFVLSIFCCGFTQVLLYNRFET